MFQKIGFPHTSEGFAKMFKVVCVISLACVIGQIALGGIVRVTESGLGCPDWPLCFGQIIPPFEFASLIEYSHRLLATLVGFFVLAMTLMSWLFYRGNLGVVVSSTVALVLVVVAALLGALAVVTELDRWVVTLHLGIAELVAACVLVTTATCWRFNVVVIEGKCCAENHFRSKGLVVLTAASVFILIVSGSHMVGLGYGSLCATWPLCGGSLFPSLEPSMVHMSHRLIAAVVALFIALMMVEAWFAKIRHPEIWNGTLLVVVVFFAQIMVGAFVIWSDFVISLRSIHLVVATLVWVSIVYLMLLIVTLNCPYSDRKSKFTSVLKGQSCVQ